ncbi:MAG: hydroxymethylbilane synthase [Candidatus Latescibacterota bacterium]
MKKVRIGTRGSTLALWQSGFIMRELHAHIPGIACELVVIATQGDRDQSSSLTRIGGVGVFSKDIEIALLDHAIDIAVHSLKDLPSLMTEGLELAATPARGPVEDALVSCDGRPPARLCPGAVVGTGSMRRRCQLLHHRPDLKMKDLRGNIDTRLRKLEQGRYDAIIMAHAALLRLGLDDVPCHVFDCSDMIPAVGQGTIAVQMRAGDGRKAVIAGALNDDRTWRAITAERAFLRALDSRCQFPVGATARVTNGMVNIVGVVGSEDGKTLLRESLTGSCDSPAEVGEALAQRFIGLGALDILREYRNE